MKEPVKSIDSLQNSRISETIDTRFKQFSSITKRVKYQINTETTSINYLKVNLCLSRPS